MPPAKYQSETAPLLQPTCSVTYDLTGLKYEGVEWIQLAHDGVLWWGLVNMVMCPWIS